MSNNETLPMGKGKKTESRKNRKSKMCVCNCVGQSIWMKYIFSYHSHIKVFVTLVLYPSHRSCFLDTSLPELRE